MKEIHTQIEIDAPIEKVWRELIAFAAYGEWNPFIPRLSGKAERGEGLTVRIQPPESRGMTFRPVVLAATAPTELRWKGKLLIPGLFDGEHSFELQVAGPGRTRLVQKEVFSGILVPMFRSGLSATRRGWKKSDERVLNGPEGMKRDEPTPVFLHSHRRCNDCPHSRRARGSDTEIRSARQRRTGH